MRGRVEEQTSMFVLGNAESLVPEGHPIREIKRLADDALRGMGGTFDEMYAEGGRDSIPPERLLKAQLLMALYSIRSERQLCEQLRYNLLFRWFLDLSATEDVFVPTTLAMENRNGLLVDIAIDEANGRIERQAALRMLARLPRHGRRITLGADRGYDERTFVRACREQGVTPHIAQLEHCRSAVDGRTTRHAGYRVSQRIRKRVEEIFGWMKTIGGLRRTRFKGIAKTQLAAHIVGAAYNLLRMGSLLLTSPPAPSRAA